jgi:hypothetical protein
VAGLLGGFLISLAHDFFGIRDAITLVPPLSEVERQQMSNMPEGQFEKMLKAREVHLSRT